ncbi:MAG: helix-hairpin-helix domain-containing protein [Anaerovoracaceae bacterium]
MKKWNEIKILEEITQIHNAEGLRQFVKLRADLLKKLALPIVVIFALVFFWISGGMKDEIEITSQNPNDPGLSDGQTVSDSDTVSDGADHASISQIYVDLGGEVNHPGVYQVSAGTRLFQVIEKAGGLKESADTDSINQAEAVSDGQKIIIGSKDDASPYYTGSGDLYQNGNTTWSGSSTEGENPGKAVRETENGSMVNINLASMTELQLLPGVGPSTAQKIVDYRQQNGKFQRIEDIKNISGIGDKTFENLKDFIEI